MAYGREHLFRNVVTYNPARYCQYFIVVCRYPHKDGGSWLKLVYVPANCTMKIQPVDAGLVVKIKASMFTRLLIIILLIRNVSERKKTSHILFIDFFYRLLHGPWGFGFRHAQIVSNDGCNTSLASIGARR